MSIVSVKRIFEMQQPTHFNETKTRCQYCESEFEMIHMKKFHEKQCVLNPNIIVCRYCRRCFSNIYVNNKHEVTCLLNPINAGKERYICNNCLSNFKYQADLRYHRKYDCGITHKCIKCDKVYSSSRILRKHVERKCK